MINTYVIEFIERKHIESTVDYRLSTHFFWYAPRLKYALIQKDKKNFKLRNNFYKFFIYLYHI